MMRQLRNAAPLARIMIATLVVGGLTVVAWTLTRRTDGADLANIIALPVTIAALLVAILALFPTALTKVFGTKPARVVEIVTARHQRGIVVRVRIDNPGRVRVTFNGCTLAASCTTLNISNTRNAQFSGGGFSYALAGPVVVKKSGEIKAQIEFEDGVISGSTFPVQGKFSSAVGYSTGLKLAFPVDIEVEAGASVRAALFFTNDLIEEGEEGMSRRALPIPISGTRLDEDLKNFGFIAVEFQALETGPIVGCTEVLNDGEPTLVQPRCHNFRGMNDYKVPWYGGF